MIKEEGCLAGVALLPGTSLDQIKFVLEEVDLVLIMSVNPGFGNQKFIASSLDKVRELK
jgi:ribulose-phosphate 3-epimerase